MVEVEFDTTEITENLKKTCKKVIEQFYSAFIPHQNSLEKLTHVVDLIIFLELRNVKIEKF